MPYMNYRALTEKVNSILTDWKNGQKNLDDTDKSIRYQEENLRALRERREKITARGEMAGKLMAGLPEIEARLLRDRLDHPWQRAEDYARVLKVSRKEYFALYKKACQHIDDLLAQVEGWEGL